MPGGCRAEMGMDGPNGRSPVLNSADVIRMPPQYAGAQFGIGGDKGVITLTPESDADLPQIRTRNDLGAALKLLYTRNGLSLLEVEKRSNGQTKHTALHEAVKGRTLLGVPALIGLLRVCGVPEDEHQMWLAARLRVAARSAAAAQRLADAETFDTASPLELGIHSAIVTPDTSDDLPAYVRRDFDFQLRNALAVNELNRGIFVVLVGGSSTGKTRSLYEAVHDVAPDWRLFHPAETEDLLELKDEPPTRTVFWLDELQRYLGSHPPLSWECVRALTRKENIVVGTLWPDQYARLKAGLPESTESDDLRRLLNRAKVIGVPDTFSPTELATARDRAEQDSRIRIALETRDAGLTQVLAGGPALMHSWELAPNPYAKAIITAAADAHRLGVQSPLSEEVLTAAMFGYLRRPQRVASKEDWLKAALPHATRQLYGDVSALSPVDGGRAGSIAGYTIADYLAQHLRRRRRTEPVPHEAWVALVTRVDRPADLRRLANSATARLRYRYSEPALARLVGEFGDGTAATELAELLVRQDRFAEAMDALRRQLAVDPRDDLVGWHLIRTQDLWRRVEAIRPAADAGDLAARERLTEILTDDGVCDDLRTRADAGDAVAAEELVERLVERGCVRELRERADLGHEYAAEALADLYVAWGEVDLLQARADLGDQAAQLRLTKVHEEGVRSAGTESEVDGLRAEAAGDPEKARQLCALLFELRDADGLRAELEAGTYGAADRLIALYTAEESLPPEQLANLRAYGLTADGKPITPDDPPEGR